ncbi:hypothetical protein VB715_18300 [Crocosphaera sp. UHCC 0190]|uniref:hypothetical protein n=1 Tax=Crocosphaera sp. UHCC 0190 TaxID=3110246 RepID=UPI002B1EA7BC|nr:hypothetical protein [Crocosphaera sp. UHCC 0190]MEA5511728.1 hypothetical protein [Crocosphaera sp. UHCC 0190]
MLKLRDFWILIALVSFTIGLYDFVALKSAKQSGDLLQEARLRADSYTEIGLGLGGIMIYELAAINAKLKEFNENLKASKRGFRGSISTLPKYQIKVPIRKSSEQNN